MAAKRSESDSSRANAARSQVASDSARQRSRRRTRRAASPKLTGRTVSVSPVRAALAGFESTIRELRGSRLRYPRLAPRRQSQCSGRDPQWLRRAAHFSARLASTFLRVVACRVGASSYRHVRGCFVSTSNFARRPAGQNCFLALLKTRAAEPVFSDKLLPSSTQSAFSTANSGVPTRTGDVKRRNGKRRA